MSRFSMIASERFLVKSILTLQLHPGQKKKSRSHHRTGGDNENMANFQGVPYNFDASSSAILPRVL